MFQGENYSKDIQNVMAILFISIQHNTIQITEEAVSNQDRLKTQFRNESCLAFPR